MANTDAPFGLRALRNIIGKTPAIREYEADAGGSHIYEGSPVTCIAGTGTDDEVVDVFNGSDDIPLLGVAAHKRLTTDTERMVAVYVDPDQEYEIQVDDGSLTHVSDYVGSAFRLVNAASGDSATYQSIAEIDGSSGTATQAATDRFIAVDKSRDPENSDYSSANPSIIVKIAPAYHLFGTDGSV